MSDKVQKKSNRKLSRTGFFIILFCLCGAILSVILFRLDLFRILNSKDEDPIGSIIIRNNVVQRRLANRERWDKLPIYSPLYSEDMIRTAELSGATLYIERNTVDMNEKTVIRIQRSPKDEDSILIYLDEGNLVITTVAGSANIALNLMGRQVEAGQGTVLSASVGKDGAVVHVSEGSATLTGDGQRREIASGTMIALDLNGAEVMFADLNPVIEQPESLSATASLLQAPVNRLPMEGHRIGIEQLRESNSIIFSWSAVSGANAYIFTLYQNTANGRRQIIRVPQGNHRSWTLENIATLGNGTFIWQVEAVNRSSAGTIESRGRIGENSFIIDVPPPGQVRIDESGAFYDN